MINKVEAGSRISAIRNRLGYSQERLAELLAVSSQAVSKWETGLSLPSVEILLDLSWISNISINSILDGSEFIDDGSGIDRGLMRIAKLLVCPVCKAKLDFHHQNGSKLTFECKNVHRFEVIDGVVYFNTREIPGELWSLWLKNYDHYLEEQRHPGLPRYKEGELYHKEALWLEIEKLRPRVILDVACGTGGGIKHIIERVRWPITVIMTDLSHRILKYNRMFFSGEWKNPFVDMVYLACDCSALPLPDNSIDMVLSHFGFESMQHKMMDGVREAYRVLSPGGHAVYNISLVDDHESENTKKWVSLYTSLVEDWHVDENLLNDLGQWTAKCEETGFLKNKDIKIYGEMPAPDGDSFPFENMILRWMANYVMVSEK